MNASSNPSTDCNVNKISQICLQKDQLIEDMNKTRNTVLQGDVNTLNHNVDGPNWLRGICIEEGARSILANILKLSGSGFVSIAESITNGTLVSTCNGNPTCNTE